MSYLPVRLSPPTTTKNQKRSGCWSSQARQPLRHPGGEDQSEPWDLVFFPAGPAGAHLVRNNSESTARAAMFCSSIATVGAVVYPDRDMIWMWTADDAVDIIVKRSSPSDEAAPWTTGEGNPEAET